MLMKTKKQFLKFQFSKCKNCKECFVITIGRNIQEKFENFTLRFVGEVAFEIFASILFNVNENENIKHL